MTDTIEVIDWHARAASQKFETRHFIDGQFVDSANGQTFENINPATGNILSKVAKGGAAEIDLAVAAARRAFKSGIWSRIAPRERMAVLYRLADLIEAHAEEFALLDTLDMGKPVCDMLGYDVPQAAITFRFLAEAIDKIDGAVTSTAPDALHMIVREPLGVVAAIVPWNFPLMMAAWKLAPALAMGNCVVLKPAEQSPSSALLLARLFKEAGGPDGVLNVVNGFGEDAGKALALHNQVDKIGFTGSTEVGKLMMVYAGQSNMKRVTTECGGKSPQIVLPDADLESVIPYAVGGIFANQGEVCSASSRLLVHSSIVDEFKERFVEAAKDWIKIGDPLADGTTMGPLVSAEQHRRVAAYEAIGLKDGASQSWVMDLPEGLDAGFFTKPMLFSGVNSSMRIAKEEIFGPVATLMTFETAEEAVAIANDSLYGLAASVWTNDLTTAHKMTRAIEAGILFVNCYDHGDMTQPWGGFKQSGQGRDKCIEGMLAHSQTKSIWINLG